MANAEVARHTAIYSLVAVARYHGIDLDVDGLIHRHALDEAEPDTATLVHIARVSGLRSKSEKLTWEKLVALEGAFPVIARLNNGNSVVLMGANQSDAQVAVLDPLASLPKPIMLARDKFEQAWSGDIILLKRRWSIADENRPFGLGWFVAEAMSIRSVFFHIAMAAMAMHVLALALPLFFQNVIDRVLVHESLSTLNVLGVGVLLALGFNALLDYLRGLLLLHATARMDIRLNTRSFDHLIGLPMAFFERASVGTLAKHMQQTTVVRNFLTGNLFMTLLEVASLFVFLPLLLFYSWKLTLIVLLFAALVATLVALLMGPFRSRLAALYQAEGERQSHLVETLHGMGTLKALSIEPARKKIWGALTARAISTQQQVGRINVLARTMIGFVENAALVAVIWFGVQQVFAKELSVGTLVAFQMLAGRVSGPLSRLVALISEFQEAALSVKMLGTVMNQPTEESSQPRQALFPRIRGEIHLEHISFSYSEAREPALRDIDLNIPAGAVVGIVGHSGSGKTTLTRLIQGFYRGYEGAIRIDGVDLREIDMAYLRRQLGVVPQENFIFRSSVRENISIARPGTSFEEIIGVARLAGAHEFIERLPRGYDTMLEENGANLSGGQKQRLAIARALLADPRILILDEATSALDPESESLVRANLSGITSGRTVIIVSHRLTTLVDADVIVVLEEGRIVAQDRHSVLLDTCSIYQNLWLQQRTAS